MKIKFNNSENFIELDGYCITRDKITVVATDLVENLSGFILYEDDKETTVQDCSDFIYRWDIYDQKENQFSYTNSETFRQREPRPDGPEPVEIVDPLTNEELMDCVADLLMETSLMKLGLEVE